MTERPVLDMQLNSEVFREFYYLKEELVDFCRRHDLPVSGGKMEITDRIARFLETGEVLPALSVNKKAPDIDSIDEDAIIEADFVCSEKHRVFFREHIGNNFSFNVAFQKWLKSNTGKTYKEAIATYL